MESYCVKRKKFTKNIDPRLSGTSNGKALILSKIATGGSKKSIFTRNEEAKRLLRILL